MITLLNVRSGETVPQRLIVLHGKITPIPRVSQVHNVSVTVTAAVGGPSESFFWKVAPSGDFRALVRLEDGDNHIRIDAISSESESLRGGRGIPATAASIHQNEHSGQRDKFYPGHQFQYYAPPQGPAPTPPAPPPYGSLPSPAHPPPLSHPQNCITLNLRSQRTVGARPLLLAILVAKDSELKFDTLPSHGGADNGTGGGGGYGGSDGGMDTRNGLQNAVKRFRLASYLWQAFCAEEMRKNGYGRRTFWVEEEVDFDTMTPNQNIARPTAKVHIVRSQKTMAEIRAVGTDLYGTFLDALREYGQPFNRLPCNVAGLILDTHWDPVERRAGGNAALGGRQTGMPSLGMFGSHLLHAVPETICDVSDALTDGRPVDHRYLADDNGETHDMKGACCVYLGAALHEVGHTFQLAHTAHGVMNRSWDFATCFVSGADQEGTDGSNNRACHWFPVDLAKFRYHNMFALPGDFGLGPTPPADPTIDEQITMEVLEDCLVFRSAAPVTTIELQEDHNARDLIEFPPPKHPPALPPRTEKYISASGFPAPTPILSHFLNPAHPHPPPSHSPSQSSYEIRLPNATVATLIEEYHRGHGPNLTLIATNTREAQHVIEDLTRWYSSGRTVQTPFGVQGYKGMSVGAGASAGSQPFQVFFLKPCGDGLAFLVRVRVHYGAFVDLVRFEYSDGSVEVVGTKREGIEGLSVRELCLGPNETIEKIHIRAGAWVDGLDMISTSGRRLNWAGGMGGVERFLVAPAGYSVVGLYGSAGDLLDSLGLIYVKE
ncbi:hypothetical protein HK102_014096 [Quaeritorhiza haematococci]|nr:hypothetical protein HK102_014096 [Quaeritorhiza haematococci]